MNTRTLTYIVSVGGFALTALAAAPENRSPAKATPSGGTVTLPLADLQILWEKSQPVQKERAPQPPPVTALVTELVLEIRLDSAQSRGTATAHVRTLVPDWQRVPLFGGDVGVVAVTCPAVVDMAGDCYGLLLHETGATTAEMTVTAPGLGAWRPETPVTLTLAPGTARRIVLHQVPKDHHVSIGNRLVSPDANGDATIILGVGETTLKLALVKAYNRPEREVMLALAQAVVASFTCHQRLVVDGGVLTEVVMVVRHHSDITLALALPAGADLLQCAVAGKPAQPRSREGGIDLTLNGANAAADGTKLELSYFTKLPPLNPAGGTVRLGLPHTPLFHERLEWTLELPASLETSGLNSNAAAAKPVQGAHTIALKREFWKADPVTAEIFYIPARK